MKGDMFLGGARVSILSEHIESVSDSWLGRTGLVGDLPWRDLLDTVEKPSSPTVRSSSSAWRLGVPGGGGCAMRGVGVPAAVAGGGLGLVLAIIWAGVELRGLSWAGGCPLRSRLPKFQGTGGLAGFSSCEERTNRGISALARL